MNPLTSAAFNITYGVISSGIFAGIVWLVTRSSDSAAPALAGLLALAVFSAGMALWVVGYRYARMLGAGGNPPDDRERQAYDQLRADLTRPEPTPVLYRRWVVAVLRWADRYFDEDSGPERSLWPRAFGLKVPAALWTPASYDRCLLLALVYPVMALFVTWVVGGEVGPAGEALGLAEASFPLRLTLLALIALQILAFSKSNRARGWKATLLWFGISAVAGAGVGAFAVAGVGVGAFAVAVAVAVAGAVAVAVAVAGAGAFAVAGAGAGAGAFAGAGAGAGAVAVAFAGAGAVAVAVAVFYNLLKSFKLDGVFLIIFTFAFGAGTLAIPHYYPGGRAGFSILLFFGLFTLLNAPFDWASLGLTRALLRLGLQNGGYWPLYTAILDAVAAVAGTAMLTLVMVVGTQAFSDIEQGSGAAITLPLPALFHRLDTAPLASDNWWLYATLLTTLIPSTVNLALGSLSWLRGLGWLNARLLRHMRPGCPVALMDRPGIVIALTAQVVAGYAVAVAAQIGLFVVLIAYVLPDAGLSLRGIAEALYAEDLPRAAWHLVFAAPVPPHLAKPFAL